MKTVTKYPKIETLYKRDSETFGVIPDELRLPEFDLIKHWLVMEKIDGTNVRVMLETDGGVRFGGRTDRAQMPTHLLTALQDMFPPEKVQAAFEQDDLGLWPATVLYGEGYGEKIQRGGKYRKGQSFRLFDVLVGQWWLNWDDVEDVAEKLCIKTVPVLDTLGDWLPTCSGELGDLFGLGSKSHVALQDSGIRDCTPEGVVARTDPLLFNRRGNRTMWKLKHRDFK